MIRNVRYESGSWCRSLDSHPVPWVILGVVSGMLLLRNYRSLLLSYCVRCFMDLGKLGYR